MIGDAEADYGAVAERPVEQHRVSGGGHGGRRIGPRWCACRDAEVGPWFGVYLQHTLTFAAPFGIAAGAALILLILFWSLRLGENAALTSMRRLPLNPARYLRRFFAQPRLRLAWTLAAARSSWWSMFHVYAPIFAVTSGLAAEAGGIVVSIGTGWIWLVPFWGSVGRRFGLRRLLQAGYVVAGVLSICALAFGTPWLGALAYVGGFRHRSH